MTGTKTYRIAYINEKGKKNFVRGCSLFLNKEFFNYARKVSETSWIVEFIDEKFSKNIYVHHETKRA